jgi:hypothetical protein
MQVIQLECAFTETAPKVYKCLFEIKLCEILCNSFCGRTNSTYRSISVLSVKYLRVFVPTIFVVIHEFGWIIRTEQTMHRYFRCFIHEVFRGSDLFVNTSCDVRANVAKQLFKVANSVLALVRVDNCRVFVIQL